MSSSWFFGRASVKWILSEDFIFPSIFSLREHLCVPGAVTCIDLCGTFLRVIYKFSFIFSYSQSLLSTKQKTTTTTTKIYIYCCRSSEWNVIVDVFDVKSYIVAYSGLHEDWTKEGVCWISHYFTPLTSVSCPQEVHVDHEMTMNQGRTVWDGKTELSYSPDSRKTLTFSSSLKDISDAYRSVTRTTGFCTFATKYNTV